MKFNVFAIVFVLFLLSCDHTTIYKAGQRGRYIDLPIECNVDQDIILQYVDSFNTKKNHPFYLPESIDFLKQGDLQYFPENNKMVYFKNAPIEAYQLCSNGVFFLSQVYDPSKRLNNWIKDREVLSKKDYYRIERRIDTLFYEVVKEARLNNVPDSIIFWRKPYTTIICKLKRP